MKVARATLLNAFALLVAVTATYGSLRLSGIGPLGWKGLGLFPCELCWYQRILMYPLAFLLLVGVLRRDARWAWYALPLSVLGALIAAYHVYVQAYPTAEARSCFVGSCTTVDWSFLGLTTPMWSFLAFALISLAGVASVLPWAGRQPSLYEG